jgi:hypothetical protein
MEKKYSLALSATLFCGGARAADWPIFRGPNHDQP